MRAYKVHRTSRNSALVLVLILTTLAACKDQGPLGVLCSQGDTCDGENMPAGEFLPFCSIHYLGGQCSQQCETSEECVQTWGKDSSCIGAGFCVHSCTASGDCPDGTVCNENMWCERESAVQSLGRTRAEEWAQAYCEAAFACECTSEPYYVSKEECLDDQRDSFLLSLDDSRVSMDESCLAERLTAFTYLQCASPVGPYDWEQRACPVFRGETGFKEACMSGNVLASQCAQGLVCLWSRGYEGQCEEDYRLPGEGEKCAFEQPECGDGLRCDGSVCSDWPDIGEECCDVYGCGSCAEGWCSPDTSTCEPPLAIGDVCDEVYTWDHCDWRNGVLCIDGVCALPEPIACRLR